MQKKLLHRSFLNSVFLFLCLTLIFVACQYTGNEKKGNVSEPESILAKKNSEGSLSDAKEEVVLKNTDDSVSKPYKKEENLPAETPAESQKESPKVEKDVYHELSFLAVGDVMVHSPQIKRAYRKETDSFDFTDSFSYVKPYITAADYAFANLETTLAGRSKNRAQTESTFQGYSGYPNFNSPESLADALKDAGFDFIGTANNHSLDKGLNGVVNTLAYLRTLGLSYTGTFDTPEERDTLKVIEAGNLKIGVIAYTYATNGISLKKEEMYRVNTLDNYNADKIQKLYADVEKAKQEPIDLLFVLMHYGNEYWERPEKNYQAGITQKLLDLGVDMVIGSHPHTLQPLIYTENNQILLQKSALSGADGATTQASGLLGIYSLGNFISSQRVISEYKTDTDTGAMLKWVYQWKNNEIPQLVKVGILPTIVVWQSNRATVLPIEDKAIETARHDTSMQITPYVESRIQNAKNTVLKRLTAYFPEEWTQSMKSEEDGFTYLYLRKEIKEQIE